MIGSLFIIYNRSWPENVQAHFFPSALFSLARSLSTRSHKLYVFSLSPFCKRGREREHSQVRQFTKRSAVHIAQCMQCIEYSAKIQSILYVSYEHQYVLGERASDFALSSLPLL
jgi:hypothetical protein